MCECYLDLGNGEPPKMVKSYEHGESFGELALMYNTPRAASIRAKTNCILWAMDRTTFQKVKPTSTACYLCIDRKTEGISGTEPDENSRVSLIFAHGVFVSVRREHSFDVSGQRNVILHSDLLLRFFCSLQPRRDRNTRISLNRFVLSEYVV